MEPDGKVVKCSGSIYIDNIDYEYGHLSYDNNQHIISRSTKIAISDVKFGFYTNTSQHKHFSIVCNAVESNSFGKNSLRTVIATQQPVNHFSFNNLHFKSVLNTPPFVKFDSDNPDIYLEYIILIYKQYE